MEDLTKEQLVLLTLFVSFVTSIATGIVTVSLMEQSPTGVTQQINRIVERTIERVVPGATTTERVEVPVVVTEQDLIVGAVARVAPAVARIESGGKTVGLGFLVVPGRLAAVVPDKFEEGEASFPGGESATVAAIGRNSGVTVLEFAASSTDPIARPVAFASIGAAAGQTAVAVGSLKGSSAGVSVGIVSGFQEEDRRIATDAATADNLGGPLLNIHGQVIGISVAPGLALPIEALQRIVDSFE